MSSSLPSTGEELDDEGEFGGRLRAFGGMGGSHGAQGFGQVASAQDGAGAGLEFAHPELFGPVVREIEILADTAVALGALPLN